MRPVINQLILHIFVPPLMPLSKAWQRQLMLFGLQYAIIKSSRCKFCRENMKKLLQQQRKIIWALFLHVFFYLCRLVETNCICLISFWVKNLQEGKARYYCFTLPSGKMFLPSFQIIKLLLLKKILKSF